MSEPASPTDPAAPRHRAGTRSRRAVLLGVIAALVLAGLATTGFIWMNSGDDGGPTAAPPPSTTAVPPPKPTRTPKPKPTKTVPPEPKIPHQVVAAAGPTKFRMHGKGFDIDATVCGMDYAPPLDPPGEQHNTVCWVHNEFGEAPGSNSKTTYLLGHAWAQDSQEVLNPISEPATTEILKGGKKATVNGATILPVTVLNGSIVTLWTPEGKLRYEVRDAYGVDKHQATGVASLMNETLKKRIVIITCGELNGTDYPFNVIVTANLISSRKNVTS